MDEDTGYNRINTTEIANKVKTKSKNENTEKIKNNRKMFINN